MNASSPPANPDIRRELKKQLLALPARSFEFFAGDFLVYIGLEGVAVTRYIGDGGIDAQGELVAGMFRIPTGIQVKRYRNNVQRPDIEKFIGALSGRFSQGMLMTTANYAPSALHKAETSIPRVLTLNGDQIVAVMVEHRLGLRILPTNNQKLDIDIEYFAAFEALKGFMLGRVSEPRATYQIDFPQVASTKANGEDTIELRPEDDLITLNALGYALRVDPARIRRWLEDQKIKPDYSQSSGGRTNYYFRRDQIEQIRKSFGLQNVPVSSAEWKQEFLDFTSSRNLSRSYKPVMLKAFFKLVDREGQVKMDDLVSEFKDYYVQQLAAGRPLEHDSSLMANPSIASDQAIKRLIITNPLERFLIKNFIYYSSEEEVLWIAPQLWRELHYYEVLDTLKNVDEQISYYIARNIESFDSSL